MDLFRAIFLYISKGDIIQIDVYKRQLIHTLAGIYPLGVTYEKATEYSGLIV